MTTRFSETIPALGMMLLSAGLTMGIALRPKPGEPVAAFFSPLLGREEGLAAAMSLEDAKVIALGLLPSIILIQSDDRDLADHLRDVGALLVLRAPYASGCFRH